MPDAQSPPRDLSHDAGAIEAFVTSLTDAWNRGDAKAFSARFAADGGFTNVLGMVDYGRPIFEQRHTEIFSTIYKGSVLQHLLGSCASSARILRS